MKKQKSQKGFTIAELLVVVAILVILLTFAAPAVIRAFVRMHLTSLDNSACTIFAAAQNRMTAMAGNGELETFAPDAPEVPGVPLDFPKKDGNPDTSHGNPGDLRYLDSQNDAHKEALKKLLPGGSIESKLAEHHYVVEYNYKTGAVYAVWYSDEDEDFTYTDIAAQERGFEERLGRSPLVGYYGGSGVDYAKVGQMPIPELTLTNAEELRLRIKMPGTPGVNNYGAAGNNIGLEITLTGETSGAEKTILGNRDGTTGALPARLGEGYTADLMLDTLKNYPLENYENSMGWTAGKQFKDWVNGSGLLPGEDITVTVTTYYAGDPDNGLYLSQSASVSTNSLFAAVEKKDNLDTPDVTEEIPTAMIAYGRHLQNLNSSTSGVNSPGAAVSITAAEQTQEIDFSKELDDDEAIYSWASTYEETADPGYRAFVPILTRVDYDGHSLPIRSLYSTGYGGLFSIVDGGTGTVVKWDNIVLIDTRVNTGTLSYVGALAGQVTNAHITDCQVYLEKNAVPYDEDHTTLEPQLKGKEIIGGLVGQVRGTDNAITDSFAATVISGETNVGGLVGFLQGNSALTIDHSYAACHLTATKTTGGPAYVSGLVGNVNLNATLSVTNCYAAGIIADGYRVAGLVYRQGTGVKITIEDSYAAVRYGDLQSGATVYGTAQPSSGTSTTTGERVYYVAQNGINDKLNSHGTKVTAKELSEMPDTGAAGEKYLDNSGKDWYHLPAEKAATPPATDDVANPTYATFPYNQTEETKDLSTPYPYPQLLMRDAAGNPITNAEGKTLPMLHYGDWLESEAKGQLVYWERLYGEDENKYYFYDGRSDGDSVNCLPGANQGIVCADGYGILVPAGSAVPKVTTYNTTYSGTTDKELKPVLKSKDITLNEKKYDFYDLSAELTALNCVSFSDYYNKIEIGEEVFWFNPDFACEVFADADRPSELDEPCTKTLVQGGKTIQLTKEKKPDKRVGPYHVVIRSARQLVNLSTYIQGFIKSSFGRGFECFDTYQWMDIDFSKYKGTLKGQTSADRFVPLGLHSWTTYTCWGFDTDGSGNTSDEREEVREVRNLYIGGGARPSYTGDWATCAGFFSEIYNYSEVRNLHLVNVDVQSGEDDLYVGGLAAVVSTGSKVENCGIYVDSADDYDKFVIASQSTQRYSYTGGLIGSAGYPIEDSKYVDVTNCFAAVKVSSDTGRAGGFAGWISYVNITDCYSAGHTVDGEYGSTPNVKEGSALGVGGFAGCANDGVKIKGVCYSTCSVSGATGRYNYRGAFIGESIRFHEFTGPEPGATVYATGKAVGGSSPLREESYLQPVKDVLVRNADDQAAAYPYDVDALGDKFPYKTNLTEHHGDWLELRMAAAFYWEKEGDAYNFELTGIDTFGQTRTLTLPEHGHDSNAITEWGYGIIKPSADSSVVTADSQGTSYVNETLVAALQDALKLPDLAAANITLWGAQDISTAADKTATTTVTVSIKGSSYGGTDKTYTLNRAFAAAIQEKDSTSELGSEEHPYQIRTLGQLKNINNAKGLYFKQTHDLNVDAHNSTSGVSSYKHKPLVLVSGGYDGGGYRILNMEIAGGTEEAGLFWKVGEGGESVTGEHKVMLENIVLYAPDGYKYNTISTSGDGKAAGGLLGAVLQTADVTIDNCVVAGYTIYSSQRDAAGGLVGSSYGKLTITNSQAVVDFRHYNSNTGADSGAGPGLGGLVGYVFGEKDNKTSVTITNSYAGGRLVKSGATGVVDKPVDYAGGLIGNIAYLNNGTATVNVTNSYAYMTGTKYGISYEGPNRNVTVANCAYLKTSNDQTGDGEAMETNDALAEWASKVTDGDVSVFGTADETYAPARTLDYYANGKGLEANDKPPEYPAYPFGAVVKDPLNGDNPVHYGTWPLYRAAGVIYWEKNVDGSCSFYLIGHNTLGRTLTQSLPENGPAIAEWGYGIFDTCAAENGWAVTVSSSSIDHLTGTPADANDIAAALNEALHLKEGTLKEGITVTLWKGMDLSNPYSRYSDDDKLECSVYVTVDKPSLGTASFESYNLYLAFAASIKEYSNGSYEGSPLGYEANPLLIRTVDQLRNINNSYNLYFKQARDLDLKGIDYKPPWLNGGGYDGGGYRILNLNVTTDDYAAGLFGWVGYTSNSNVHRRVALKNIILYAPGGDGTIEATNSMTGAAGGLVGYIYDRAKVTIDNCVVAGYTISSASDLAGGLVGATSTCELTVLKSQAVVDLVCHDMTSSYSSGPGLGGLVGYMSGDYDNRNGSSITVTNSYAGGRVVNTAGSPVESGYAGGLVGHVAYLGPETSVVSTKVDIDHSYTYMTGTKYGISHDGYEGLSPEDQAKFKGAQVTVTDCAYLQTSTGQTQSGTVSNVNAEVTINDLADWTKELKDSDGNVVFSTAGKTYVPTKVIDKFVNSSDGLAPYGTPYPFGAIVTDDDQPVHYGTWPTTVEGISAPPVEDGPGIIELTCICTEKCTADSICETCPVCSVDYNACQPTDPAGDDLTEDDDLTGGEPTPEPTASPDPNAAPVEGEPTPTPGSTPDPAATPEPEASPAPEVTPEPEPAPEPEVTPEPEPEPPPEPETTPAPETPPEPSESNTTPAPAGDDTPEPTPTEGAPVDPDAASGTTGEGGSPE